MKLLLAATAADEWRIAIDTITDGGHTVLKAIGQCGVMRGGKHKNKGYKGTKRSGVPVVQIRFLLMNMAMRTPLLCFGRTLTLLLLFLVTHLQCSPLAKLQDLFE